MAIRKVLTVFGIIAILAVLSGFIHTDEEKSEDNKSKN